MQDNMPLQRSIGSRVLGMVSILFTHFLTLLILLFVFVKVVPMSTAFFEQAELELPAGTVLTIRISDAFVMYWYLVIFLGMVLDGVVVALLSFLSSKRTWLVSFYSHVWLLAAILLLSWTCIAIAMPLMSLVYSNEAFAPPSP